MAQKGKEYGYCVIYRDDEELIPDYTIECIWDAEDLGYIAEEAAEDYYGNHDGWECDWPVKFAIFDGGTLLGKCEVELEHNPSFSADIFV